MREKVPGIGPKTEGLLKKLKIETIGDLITTYPRYYTEYPDIVSIGEAKEGEACAVEGWSANTPVSNGKVAKIIVMNGAESISVSWFHVPPLAKTIKSGVNYVFYGTISTFNGRKQMVQPSFFEVEQYKELQKQMHPVYPLTSGLTQAVMKRSIQKALEIADVYEDLPDEILKKYDLIDKKTALSIIHAPISEEELKKAKLRLKYNEIFSFIINLRLMSSGKEKNLCPMPVSASVDLIESRLPFQLTNGQKDAWERIKSSVAGENHVVRLIQGDVGCGKTILAFLSLFLAAENGYQGALLAPTEVLATQHFEDICELIEQQKLPYKAVLLTGSTKKKKQVLEKIANGEYNIVIGTHAIIQDSVEYHKLGMIITDEQHRFGVEQRKALELKGEHPHHLVMSATPIPRSLGLVIYGDMEVSLIKERPANRLPIKNCVLERNKRAVAWKFVMKQIAEGHQAYVICPMVEENEDMDVAAVTEYVNLMRKSFPDEIKIGLLHGKSKDKEQVMNDFSENKLQILVSTTVVEVGVNVPNATVMVIEDANRFGLSQLHQLRGRVGRGDAQSYCIFINGAEQPCDRLEIMAKSNDGFEIAEEDMRLRGIGDLFGVKQSGMDQFKIADLYTDAKLVEQVASDVDDVVQKHHWLIKILQ